MTAKLKSLLAFILILGTFQSSISATIAGGEISYICLGGNSYEITFSLYRDCRGGTVPNSVNVSFQCSSNPLFDFTATLPLVANNNGYEVTQNCQAIPTACTGGNSYGVQIYIYKAVATLPPCDSWKISYLGCCRNATNNLINSQSNYMYVEAHLDNLNAPCNTSPQFTNYPIFNSCVGTTQNYCQGTIDLDGDSLSYKLITPWNLGPGTNNPIVTFNGAYSSSQPFGSNPPLIIDSASGCISYTPTSLSINTFSVLVEEWRPINGVMTKIGDLIRDMQLQINACNNHLPLLGGMDFSLTNGYSTLDTTFFHHTTWGQNISFNIWGFDADTFNQWITGNPELFDITWNNGIPGANFTVYNSNSNNAYASFSWTPNQSDSSSTPHCFTATIFDNTCPYLGSQSFSYCILVDHTASIHLNHKPESALSIIPNPSTGRFVIETSHFEGKKIIEIYNSLGQVVRKKESNEDSEDFNLSYLNRGMYFIKVYNEEKTMLGKISIY